jgi:hypothetical protein
MQNAKYSIETTEVLGRLALFGAVKDSWDRHSREELEAGNES